MLSRGHIPSVSLAIRSIDFIIDSVTMKRHDDLVHRVERLGAHVRSMVIDQDLSWTLRVRPKSWLPAESPRMRCRFFCFARSRRLRCCRVFLFREDETLY